MRKLIFGMVMLMFSLASLAQSPSAGTANSSTTPQVTTLHGWVVDEVCGRVTGRTSEHASCARMCSRMTHRTLVFVSDYNGVNIAVKNQESLKPYMGKHLDIEARLIAPKEIEVLHVDPASANASPNDPIAAHDELIVPKAGTRPVKSSVATTGKTKRSK